jgi:hypothetical protein
MAQEQEQLNRLFVLIAMLAFGCARPAAGPTFEDDSYVVIKHETDGDHYVIRHGNIEIQASCQSSTYALKGQSKIYTAYCLQPLPIGQKLKMVRGQGDWLYCTWEVHDTDWTMALRVEKEEVKGGGSKK